MSTFFATHKDTIAGLTSLVGIVVAPVGFGLTIWQIHKAAEQLRASNEYSIRRDLRELIQKIDPKTDIGLGLLFNFHYSVYLQAKSGGVSDTFERDMANDFCSWLTHYPNAKTLWEKRVQDGDYGPERQKMREEWC